MNWKPAITNIQTTFKGIVIFSFLAIILHSCNKSDKNAMPNPDIPIEEVEKEYVLVWSDEFDIDGKPNPDNWKYENGFVRNKELQWYQEDNAFVENGLLIIEGRRDTFDNPYYDPDSESWRLQREKIYFTSSSINTEGKFTWKYGRFEIRAKIKAEEGLWPAIWTLGQGHEWPQGGEIDIMEYYDGKILANAAWAGKQRWQAVWDDFRIPVEDLGEGWADEFHIWRLDWTEDFIKIYVDDRLLNTVELSKTINQRGNQVVNPFRETQQYILLNLAIAGTNGGDPSDATFPSRYEIDYVRVYQLQ